MTIKTDGITLVGEGTVILEPPENPVENECTNFAGPIDPTVDDTPSQAGICVTGSGLSLSDFIVEHRRVNSVRRPVKGVSISGITVQGFSGFNILVIGAEDADVHDNTLRDGPKYGFLTAGSRNTKVSRNVVTTSAGGFVGICMDNFSKVKIAKNKVSIYYIGLCIQTNGAEVEDNEVSDACYGAFLDPGVRDVRFRNNHIFRAFPSGCAPFGAAGINLDGAIGARVENNLVEGWKSDDPELTAGIFVVDDPCNGVPSVSLSCLALGGGPAVSRNNRIRGNTLRHNTLDIYVNTTGRGNEFRRNDCDTSNVDGVCD